jgi:hypothetical protein
MLGFGELRLKQLLDMFPRISELSLGKPDMDGLEEAFRRLSRGDEQFSFKHIEILKDEEHRYWRFLDWWRMPAISPDEIDELSGLFMPPRPEPGVLTKRLFAVLKNIEIVSCVLRFTDPGSFGIISPPVENLLNVRGHTPCEKYVNYIDALRKLRIESGFARNADVDMALWTLAHILNSPRLRNSDQECWDVVDRYYKKPNPIKRIAAKNSLEQFLDEKDYLNIADMFVENDHAIAVFIAGREIERYLKKLCKRHGYATTEIVDGFERDRKVSAMLKDLENVIGRDDKNRVRTWYRIRGDIIHDKKFGTIEEVEHVIAGLREFRERRLR